ncbi:transcription factor MYBS3-like [Silene latifolia]|uniref:transcription factor MYBS3-like n=1 Tax=Silene latifolia TaxID=37657 RepID=UPI003D77B5C5
MTRRCSHCSNNGHNSRTCPTRAPTAATANGGGHGGGGGGVRLFGVRLTDGSFMKKSASMGNLSHYYNNNHASPSSAATSPQPDQPGSPAHDPVRDGYLSDDPNHHVSCSSSNRRGERKKGKPWTEEEHRLFLIGLQKLGKGDWRGIARSYVISRTPTQVASHAQKYFIRQSNATRRKRRSSLFDMVPDMVAEGPEGPENVPEEQSSPPQPFLRETDSCNALPSLDLSLGTESEPMETTPTEEVQETQEIPALPPPIPTFFIPIPYPPSSWKQNSIQPEIEILHHQVLKPTPVHRTDPANVDHLVGMSQLNLSETENGLAAGQPQLSLSLLGPSSRQSAFHASAPAGTSSELQEGKNSSSSVIQAV